MHSIIIHHSLTTDGQTVSWPAIRRYHTQVKCWDDIGYHFGIELIEDNFEILFGRPLHKQGAHTKGHNSGSIGICVVGNFDKVKPPAGVIRKLCELVLLMQRAYDIRDSSIYFHRDFASYKTCPGKLFDKEVFIESLRSYRDEHIF